ncbi:MAG: TIGR03086 family metal-binding protein [Acidimicrobiia bacterium]
MADSGARHIGDRCAGSLHRPPPVKDAAIQPDLGPAARQLADLAAGVDDDQLPEPTPCPDYTLGDLLDHVGGLALAFRAAAEKAGGEHATRAPSGDASRLGDDWRARIPGDLRALADAWRDPAAWTGTTMVGGLELPGQQAGIFALDELVLHGWDVARASGQRYECDARSLEAVHALVLHFSAPEQAEARRGLFGPVVDVPDDADRLDRVLGLSGRNPQWPEEPPSRA